MTVKKFLSLFIALAMLASLCVSMLSCGDDNNDETDNNEGKIESASYYLEQSDDKIKAANGNFACEITQTAVVKNDGQQLSSTDVKMEILSDGTNYKLTTDANGTISNTVVAGDWIYMQSGIQKVKILATDQSVENIVGDFDETITDGMEYTAFSGGTVTKTSAGDYQISFSDQDGIFDDEMEELKESFELSMPGSVCTVESYTLEILIGSDLNYKSVDMDIAITILYSGETLDLTQTISYAYKDIGAVAAITAPADADSYVEASY